MTAADLKRMAEQSELTEAWNTLGGVCAVVGVGLAAAQSRGRDADTAKKRAVVAWVLHDRLKWPVSRVARALRRTPRQVKRMVAQERN